MNRSARAILCSVSLASLGCAWLIASQGCSLITSYDGFAPVPGPTCGTPVPSAPASGGDGDVGALAGAAKSIRFFDMDPKFQTLGYDLDGLCTTDKPDTKVACKSLNGQVATDLPLGTGIDNAIGVYITSLGLNPFDMNGSADGLLQQGLVGLGVNVTKWNGEENDPSVAVALYNIVGVNNSTDGGAGAKFDGQDDFIVGDAYIENGAPGLPDQVPLSKFVDARAYVSGGVLVAHFGTLQQPFKFRFLSPNLKGGKTALEIVMTELVFVGKIKKPAKPGSLEMDDAQFTGRMQAVELLRSLSVIGYYCSDGGGPIPGGSEAAAEAKTKACNVLDLPDSHARDGKNAVCQAASFAIGVTITTAKLGNAGPTTIGPYICDDPTAKCP